MARRRVREQGPKLSGAVFDGHDRFSHTTSDYWSADAVEKQKPAYIVDAVRTLCMFVNLGGIG